MFWMGFAAWLAILPGCDNFGDDEPIVNPQEVAQVTTHLVTGGQWRIEQFIDEGVDKTAIYASYILNFLPDGTVRLNQQTGTWQLTRDGDDVELNLLLPPVDRFAEELNEDWDVKETSLTQMLLEDDDDDGAADRSVLKLMKIL